ncbi:MAG: amidohydrolase family protein [Planctomycetota bacterium]|jgi:predicted TIM-barrel fold metal-dependent hydrolase
MKIIDFHTHLDDRWFDVPLIDPESFIEGLNRCKVAKACIFTMMGLYGNCAEANDRLARQADAYPDRLIPFATVDPKLGEEALEELERCLSNPIFGGVKFHTWLQAVAPSMVKNIMVKLLQCAARYGVPVVFHDATPPYASTFQIATLARWVPQATVVLGHAGISDYVYTAGQLLRDIPNLHACFCGPKAGELSYLIETAGADKILFGSDFGFSDWKILCEKLDDVTESGIPANIQEKILFTNAQKLLNSRV